MLGGDRWIVDTTLGWLTPESRLVWEGAGWLGTWVVEVTLLALVTGAGYLARRPRLWTAGLRGLLAFGLSGLLTTLLKHAACRRRPFLADGGTFHPVFCLQDGLDSFPSGHAAQAFAIAVVVGTGYPRLAVPVYLLASIVSLSRVVVGVHYPSDVLAGAAIGLLSGVLCRRQLRRLVAAWQAQREGSQ
jgi:undecaprenyl-diphosphatase